MDYELFHDESKIKGYWHGIKGEQIPLAAQLFAIVDVWDALRSDRPYRQRWQKEKVCEHIKALSGRHFDPKVVDLFFKMINEEMEEI